MMAGAQEKYSATLFWNDVLRSFRSRMPVKTHRRKFKSYPESFTGREAVDWLHGYLSAKMQDSREVNREQSISLFSKFHEIRLFYQVGPKANSEELYTTALYRFSNLSISAITRTPLACKNAETGIHGVADGLSDQKKRRPTFRQLIFNKGRCDSQQPSDRASVDEASITDQRSHSSNIPREVGKQEIDYLWKQCCLDSLKEFFGSSELLTVLESCKVEAEHIAYNACNSTSRGIAKVPNRSDDMPGWALRGMKCLANWPWLNGIINTTCYVGFERDVFTTLCEYFNSSSCIGCFVPIHLQQLFFAILDHAEMLDAKFSMENQTQNAQRGDCSNLYNPSVCTNESGTKRRLCDVSDEFSECPQDIRKNDESSVRFGELTFAQRTEMLNDLPGLVQSPKLLAEVHRISKRDLTDGEGISRGVNGRASFSCTIRSGLGGIGADVLNRPRLRSSIVLCPDVYGPLHGHRLTAAPRLCSFRSLRVKQMTLDALSIAMLLMPPKNRRWIQLLLRFIDRVSSNYCLKLDRFKSISNRALLINALSCCFVYPPISVLHSDGVRLLSCLLDLQAEIFKPPVGLENRVKAKLLQARCTAPPKVFCEQVSVEEYRRQAMANSMDAVLQLLEDIVQDEHMSREDKTKRLRDFQMTYPILYQQRFPNDPVISKKESFFEQLKEKFGLKHTHL